MIKKCDYCTGQHYDNNFSYCLCGGHGVYFDFEEEKELLSNYNYNSDNGWQEQVDIISQKTIKLADKYKK